MYKVLTAIKDKLTSFRLAVIITLIVAAFCYFYSEKFQTFRFIELKMLDMRFRMRGPQPPSDDIVIVMIDDYSIELIGRWPWPRSIMGEAVSMIAEDGARSVGVDILFTEPEESDELYKIIYLNQLFQSLGLGDQNEGVRRFENALDEAMTFSDSDGQLADVLSEHPSVVIPLVFYNFTNVQARILDEGGTRKKGKQTKDERELARDAAGDFIMEMPDEVTAVSTDLRRGYSGKWYDLPKARELLMPITVLLYSAGELGFVNFFPDVDGGLRWENMAIEFRDRHYLSMGLQMLKNYYGLARDDFHMVPGQGLAMGNIVTIPTDENGRLLINYYGPYGAIKRYSIADLLDGIIDPGAFEGKLVLIGVAATGLGDVWLTPFDQTMPGVEKHATVISNVLNHDFLKRNNKTALLDILIIAAIGLLLGYFLPKMNPTKIVATSLGCIPVVVGLNYFLFSRMHLWVNLIYPLVNLLLVASAVIIFQYFTEMKSKRQIKKAFKHYLNDALVEQLSNNPDGLKLGGEEKELTVMFSDIRSFTTISEGLTPEQLVSLINAYLSQMTRLIMQHNGVVDKFIGDAIMAIYGAPLYYEDHPGMACRSAVHMMALLKEKKPEWMAQGYPEINIGIGINTGRMVVGNMGSEDRFDYTVMGDSVNLASRLEGLCKMYGSGIVVSEFTAGKIAGFALKELDMVRVKGKLLPIKIFELVGEEPLSAEARAGIVSYNEALGLYKERKWKEANEAFSSLRAANDTMLHRLYAERCESFLASPPPDDWDGVFTLKTK